jgi:hypothetical protein
MRRVFLLGFAVLAGCAGGQHYDETTPKQAAIFSAPETGTLLSERPRAVTSTIAVPPATVWLAVKKAYLEIDVPVTVENPSARQIGNQNFYKTRTFAGHAMTDFVDCGSGMTGPKASTYRIYMSLLTDVIPDGQGGTRVQTTFVPMGQDMMGNSTDRIVCGTTGRLEALFLEHVKSATLK